MRDDDIVPEPYFENGTVTFSDSVKMVLKGYTKDDTIHYTLFDSGAGMGPKVYTRPFYLHGSGCVTAWLTRNGKGSMENSACYTKIPKGRKIHLISQPDKPYTTGGAEALIDYQHGTTDYSGGNWLGYQGKDFEAVVDLGKVQIVKEIKAEFLQDAGAWIMMPRYVDISVSSDSVNYMEIIR